MYQHKFQDFQLQNTYTKVPYKFETIILHAKYKDTCRKNIRPRAEKDK